MMQFQRTILIEIDIDKIIADVKQSMQTKDGFTKAEGNRLLKLYELFKAGKWEECDKAYDALPYNENGEFPEQEFVSQSVIDQLCRMIAPTTKVISNPFEDKVETITNVFLGEV